MRASAAEVTKRDSDVLATARTSATEMMMRASVVSAMARASALWTPIASVAWTNEHHNHHIASIGHTLLIFLDSMVLDKSSEIFLLQHRHTCPALSCGVMLTSLVREQDKRREIDRIGSIHFSAREEVRQS